MSKFETVKQLAMEHKETLLYGCAAFGAYKMLMVGNDVAYGIWKHLLRPRRNLKSRYGGTEPWAVVTGGASGLGLAYAKELSAEGFSVLLVDKNGDALQSAAAELARCETLAFDLADVATSQGLKKLETALDKTLEGKDVAVLVNNAAEFQGVPLVDAAWDYVLRATHVNAHAYAAMCRYFVPKLLKRQELTGNRGALVNIGTCAAEPQNPRFQFTIYGASKAYGHILSSSMNEMYSDKLDVMTVIPRQCHSGMNTANYKFTLTPDVHAKAVIDQLGYENVTYGPLTHCLEYNMRFNYQFFGLFDSYVQWCNRSGNLKLLNEAKAEQTA